MKTIGNIRRLFIKTMLAGIVSLIMPIELKAQNNPFKIDDKLYEYYVRASNARRRPICVAIADTMYNMAMLSGDKKAACIALTVPVGHYQVTLQEEKFNRAADRLMAEARKNGELNYYYYARSARITLYINLHRYLQALQETEQMGLSAEKDGNYYGKMLALRAIANIYMINRNYEMAVKYFKESLYILINHLPDQDQSVGYMRLARCLQLSGNHKAAIEADETGLALLKNPGNAFAVADNLLRSYYEMGPDYKDKFNDVYTRYKKYIDKQGTKLARMHLAVLYELMNGRIDAAEKILQNIKPENAIGTYVKLETKKGNYDKALAYTMKYFINRDSLEMHESPIYQIAELNATLENSLLSLNNLQLEYEMAQRLLKQKEAEAKLEEEREGNTTMLLANDSLTIARMKADSLRLCSEHDTHELELSVIKSEARTKKIISLVALLALTFVLCYFVTAFIRSRRHLRRLNEKNKELTEALDHAEELERMKSAFVKNLSYDIRTPLNSVVGFSELMLNGEGLSEDDKADIKQKIEESSTILTSIVNDVLQLSYIESGRQTVEKADSSLNAVVKDSIREVDGDAKKDKTIGFADSTDIELTTDKKLLKTALIHSMQFALNHTTADTIELTTTRTETNAVVSIDYKIDKGTECDERALTGNAVMGKGMEPYKMSLPVSRAAMTKLKGDISFGKAGAEKAYILLSIPLKAIVALLLMTASLLCPLSAKAQFTKEKLEPEIYKIYTEAQNNRDLPLGLQKAREVYRIGVARGDKYIQCVGLGVELQHHVMNSNDKQAFEVIRKIQQLASDINDTLYYYMAFSNEVAIHLNNHHTLKALKCCLDLRDKVDKTNDHFGKYTCYRSLGDIYRVRNNRSQSCQWYIKALELYKKYNIKHDPTMSILRIVMQKRQSYDYEEARKYIEEARKIPSISRYKYLTNIEEAFLAFETNDTLNFNRLYALAIKQKEKYGYRYPDKEAMLEVMHLTYAGREADAVALAKERLTEFNYKHLATCILKNEKKWDLAAATFLEERKQYVKEQAKVFDSDKTEMNEMIGNNKLEAYNVRLKLEAANLEIEHHKALAELARYEKDKQQLLANNNRLAISKMEAYNQLESTYKKRNDMQKKQHTADARQSTVTFFLAIVFTLLAVVVYLLYKRTSKRHARRLKEKNMELIEARKRAEMSDKMKSIFIQNMSHEIRTPLNAIVGFSQLMLSPDMELDKEEREEFGNIIRTNSELLTTLVGDIISLSELESGRYKTNLHKVNVNRLCNNALTTVKHRCKTGVEMVFEKQLDDNYTITTDEQRVSQVLINYLTNAIKYTEKGSITISAKADEAEGIVTFSVTDTGIGIPLDKQKDIFERFMKLDDFHQGTGLGLNICSLIVEKLGGEVGIDPTYTNGSRFLLKLKN